jgi:plastocyanin
MRYALSALLIAAAAGCGDRDAQSDPAITEDTVTAEPPPDEQPAVRGFPAPSDSSRPAGTLGGREEGTRVVADMDEFTISLSSDTVPVGQVTIAVHNTGTIPHALELVADLGGRWRSLPAAPGATIEMTMLLSNGTYRAYCPLDDDAGDHSERGMQAVLVVN